jgi:hypothetical protein
VPARKLKPTLPPPFPSHVGKVLSTRAEPQMIRAHARRIVAMVANKQTIRDRAVVQLPRVAMSQSLLPLMDNGAVAGVDAVPAPQPAGVGLLDAVPEARLGGVIGLTVLATRQEASEGTESPLSARKQIVLGAEGSTAMFAWALGAASRTAPSARLGLAADSPSERWNRERVAAQFADGEDDKLGRHRSYPFGVAPPATTNRAGASSCLNYSRNDHA